MGPPAPRARRRRLVVSGLAVTLFLAAWEVAPRVGAVDPFFTSQPSRILGASLDVARSGQFGRHVWASLVEFGTGFGLALALAVPAGLLIGSVRQLRYLCDPPIMALQATPHLALLPILVVWLGIGLSSKIAIVLVSAAIPIVVNTSAGVTQVDRTLLVAARAFGAQGRDLFTRVVLPASLPSVVTGIRLGVGRGVLGVVVGEMYVSQVGVGNQITQYGAAFRVDHLLFYTLLVSGFGFAATSAVRWIERRLPAGRRGS